MPTDQQAIHLARAAAFAIALIVPTISTPVTSAYADNESPAGISPPYRAAENDQARSPSCPPAASAKSDVLGAGRQTDELARKIYRPGVSDR
jgi:hypothetical protein